MGHSVKQIEIFRAGTHTSNDGQKITFSEADLSGAAKSYDPTKHEAPLVVGHPKLDTPAYGWVKELSFKDGSLIAGVDQLNPEFAEMVKSGSFKKVSAAFYTPDHSGNPVPGKYTLRHVGFLGGTPPAIKGLRAVEFSADESGVVTFGEWNMGGTVARMFRGLRDLLIEKFDKETADRALSEWDITWLNDEAVRDNVKAQPSPAFSEPPQQQETIGMKTAEQIAAEQAALDKREKDIKDREAAFAEAARTTRRAANGAFVDSLIKDAKFPAGEKDVALAFMEQLDADKVITFGEGDAAPKATVLEQFKTLLGKLPASVTFGEAAPADGIHKDNAALTPAQLADKATAYKTKRAAEGVTVSYSEAAAAVAADPSL